MDPALKKIIRRLEADSDDWGKTLPPYLHHALHQKAWDDFTRGKIGELRTDQIAALAAVLDKTDDTGDFLGYLEAIYFVWGARDFSAARAHILKAAADGQPEWSKSSSAVPGSIDFNFKNYRTASLALASLDPRAAWTAFLADGDDPKVNGLMKVDSIQSELFKIYAASDPKEAWRLYLAEEDGGRRRNMLYGYVAGAPAGKDWETLAGEFDRLLPLDENPFATGEREEFASRWLIEEPEQALEWFAARVDLNYFKKINLLGLEEDPPDLAIRVKMELLDELFRSNEYRIPETVAVLQHLASGADEELAARSVSWFIGASLSPSDSLPLLAVIPHFKSPQLREELFFKAAQAVPSREYTTERSSIDMSFDHPNVCLDAVRALAAELELPEEVRERAEAVLREVEKKEAEKQDARKRSSFGQ